MKKAKQFTKALVLAVFGLLSSCATLEKIDAEDIDKAAKVAKSILPLVRPEK